MARSSEKARLRWLGLPDSRRGGLKQTIRNLLQRGGPYDGAFGIMEPIGNHTFRATGITAYLLMSILGYKQTSVAGNKCVTMPNAAFDLRHGTMFGETSMALSSYERALGMDRSISRRDFLNGVAVGLGAASSGIPARMVFGQALGTAYPPALGGLRGQTDQAAQTLHALRDGTFWKSAGEPRTTGSITTLSSSARASAVLLPAWCRSRAKRLTGCRVRLSTPKQRPT
jgi:hypothetical protein